jgi:hypothetical protein
MHRLPLLPQDATTLALALMAANTAANCGKIAAVINNFHSVAKVTLGKLGNPIRDIIADRTALLTSRYFAIQTSLSFLDSLRETITFRYFCKHLMQIKTESDILLNQKEKWAHSNELAISTRPICTHFIKLLKTILP